MPSAVIYTGCVILVAVFVNLFPVWQWLAARLHAGLLIAGPIVAAAVMLSAIFMLRSRLRWLPVVLALLCAGTGLLIADPLFPAKRIHVAEYMLLGGLLHLAVPAVGVWPRTAVAALAGLLFGIHDEMIQGLLPDRTYGLVDIAVNGLGAAAGALLLQGLRRDAAAGNGTIHHLPCPFWAVLAGVLLEVVALGAFRDRPLPLWTVTPLLASGAACFLMPLPASVAARHVFHLILALALTLALYPVLTHVAPFRFR